MDIFSIGTCAATLVVDPFVDTSRFARDTPLQGAVHGNWHLAADQDAPRIADRPLVVAAVVPDLYYPTVEEQRILHEALLASGRELHPGYLASEADAPIW